MRTKYLLLRPTKIEERTLGHLDDEADLIDLERRARDLQVRRWRKVNQRIRQESRFPSS
jgi:hypothetical protein